jgi:nitric oxide reductase large subunit
MSLLPQGLWQTYYSISHYYAYARSAEVMHSTVMEGLVLLCAGGFRFSRLYPLSPY